MQFIGLGDRVIQSIAGDQHQNPSIGDLIEQQPSLLERFNLVIGQDLDRVVRCNQPENVRIG